MSQFASENHYKNGHGGSRNLKKKFGLTNSRLSIGNTVS